MTKALCVLLGGLLTGGALQAETLRCDIVDNPHTYYVAPSIELSIGGFGEVEVKDAIIASTGRSAAFGKVVDESSSRRSIRWDLTGMKPNPQESRFQPPHLLVRLTIQKASGAAALYIIDANTRGREYRAKGRCAVIG